MRRLHVLMAELLTLGEELESDEKSEPTWLDDREEEILREIEIVKMLMRQFN